MTWHVHPIGAPIEHGRVYHSADEAQAARADGQTITVVLSDHEQNAWTDREARRQNDGTYQLAPFQLATNAPWAHFAHLSRAREVMIAYTANPQRGHLDRHEVMTPCRYMMTFCPQLDEAAREVVCGEIRASMSATLHMATSADDIERAYNVRTSWTSCMAGQYESGSGTWVQRWDSGGTNGDRRVPSPVRAYGDSDLALAWIGTRGATPEQDTLAARAIVWPERKAFTRLYGDQPRLQAMLVAEGWTQVRSLTGARIRRIVLPSGDLSVPYVDGSSRATTEGEDWLRLGGDGRIDTSQQSGQVSDEGVQTCSRHDCDREADEGGNDQGLCARCYDAQCTCADCDETFEDSDEGTYSRSGDFYCETCYDEHEFTCQCCDEQCQPLALRGELDNEGLCFECQDAQLCDSCTAWTTGEMTDERCEDCTRTAALQAVTAAVRAALDAGATVQQITVAVGQ